MPSLYRTSSPRIRTFSRRTSLQASPSQVFSWHARPGALERLSPPWDPPQIVRQEGGIRTGARVEMRIKLPVLPLRITWIAEHIAHQDNACFIDRQRTGPFALWQHTHAFTPAQQGCCLEDHIEYALPFPPFGDWLGNRIVRRKLDRMFTYRQRTLSADLQDDTPARPKTILISGGSGVVGSDLIPYLRTKGHRVIRLVRRPPAPEKDEVFWDPASGHLDLAPLGPVDAVINLSGRNIGHMPWTASNKQAFVQSRVETTALLIKALARMNTKPEVLINASAIGYYGHRADHPVSENDAAGTGFIASICRQWEHTALPAAEQGIRVVLLRMGVVLTPKGGALKQMLPAFRMGLGGAMGSGAQWISWIGMDDLLGVINAVLHNPALQGPVNAVSPNPVTNRHFAKTLARVLKRPVLLPVPKIVITGLFGQMGREVLLSGARVLPDTLLQAGYRFRHPELETGLRHLLGKTGES